jgi:hypothetical protein
MITLPLPIVLHLVLLLIHFNSFPPHKSYLYSIALCACVCWMIFFCCLQVVVVNCFFSTLSKLAHYRDFLIYFFVLYHIYDLSDEISHSRKNECHRKFISSKQLIFFIFIFICVRVTLSSLIWFTVMLASMMGNSTPLFNLNALFENLCCRVLDGALSLSPTLSSSLTNKYTCQFAFDVEDPFPSHD